MNFRILLAMALTAVVLAPAVVYAQTQRVLADKIVGQVGDKFILRSDIINTVNDYKNQKAAVLPTECDIMEASLIQKALVLQAERDSLPLSDEELSGALDNKIRYFIQAYGSQQMLEEIAGKTVYQIKEQFRPQIRDQILSDAMRKKIIENVKVTPVEVEAYYNKIPKDSLYYYESELELSTLTSYPKANKDVDEYVSNQLYELKKQVESGQKSFDALAKLYSQDPAVVQNGGQYTLNRTQKDFDPAFMAAAFKLKDGQISPVVKSKFGYHIIQMVSRSGDDAVVKHILKIPQVTDEEVNLKKHELDSVRNLIVSGQMTFGNAVNKYSDDEMSKFSGGAVVGRNNASFVKIDELPDKDMLKLIDTLKPGSVSAPQDFTDAGGKRGVRLLWLRSKTAPHRENLKEDYNKIAERAAESKKNAALDKWFADHIPGYYVRVDPDYGACKNIAPWLQSAQTASVR